MSFVLKGQKISKLIALHTLVSACAGVALAVSLFMGFLNLEYQQQQIAEDDVTLAEVLRMEESYHQWLIMMDLILGNEQTYLAAGAKRQGVFFLNLITQIGQKVLARDLSNAILNVKSETNAALKQVDLIINGDAISASSIIEFDDGSAATVELLFHIKASIQLKAQHNKLIFQKDRSMAILLSFLFAVLFIFFIGAQWILLSLQLVRPVEKLSKAVAKAQKEHQAFQYNNDSGPLEIRKLAEDTREFTNKLVEFADHAEKSSLAKTEFLSVMSHEIRTPLNAIIGFSEILKDTRLNQTQKEHINIVIQSGNSLLTLINNILDFSKIEAGKMELDPVWFDMYLLLVRVMSSNRYASSKKSLLLKYKVDKDVPRYLYGDEQKIRQILFNLLNNAVKFTEYGSITLNVSVKLPEFESGNDEQEKPEFCEVAISVRDTGIGIDIEKQLKLFSPFTQADVDTTRKYGGTGLGLAIVHQMVILLGGDILLSSKEGQGTEFVLKIPLAMSVRKDLATARIKPSLISLVIKNQNSALAIQLKQLGYSLEYIDATEFQLLNKAGFNQNSKLLLFSAECLEQALFWFQHGGSDTPNIVGAYCSNNIENNTIAKHLSEMPSILVSQNGLVMVEQIENLIDTESVAANLCNLGDEVIILVAEDNPVNLLLTQNLLKQLGIYTLSVTNGQQAVNYFRSEKIALILMDCQMPIMDGFSATKEIRRIEKQEGGHIPIIALTANALKGDRDACISAGMDDYLSKPFNKNKLLKVIEPWLAQEYENKAKDKVVEFGLSSETESNAILDVEQLNELLALDESNSKVFITQLSAIFFNNAQQLSSQMEQALTTQSMTSVANLAHQLKSSSMNVAAKRLSNLFKKLEDTAIMGDAEYAMTLWSFIKEEYQQVEKAYHQLLNEQ